MTRAAGIAFATPILLLVIVRVGHAVVPVLHVEEVVLTPAARISFATSILLLVMVRV